MTPTHYKIDVRGIFMRKEGLHKVLERGGCEILSSNTTTATTGLA